MLIRRAIWVYAGVIGLFFYAQASPTVITITVNISSLVVESWQEPTPKTIYVLVATDCHNYIPFFPAACSQILSLCSALAFVRRYRVIVGVVFFLDTKKHILGILIFWFVFPFLLYLLLLVLCAYAAGNLGATECTGQQSHRLVGFLRHPKFNETLRGQSYNGWFAEEGHR